jgi:hypothetical protein
MDWMAILGWNSPIGIGVFFAGLGVLWSGLSRLWLGFFSLWRSDGKK